jgi:hypothetical protein
MRLLALLMVFVLLVASGCGQNKIKVTGKVSLKKGGPLPGGMVVLSPNEGGLEGGARGYLQEDGTFVVSTDSPGDGLLAGKYKVLVVHPPKKGGEDAPPGPLLFHPKYGDFTSSGLVADITSENRHLEFVLDPPNLRN